MSGNAQTYRGGEGMTTHQQLQDRTTPEFIKWCCEYAEGFKTNDINEIVYRSMFSIEFENANKFVFFPLLLHRAVEGWNKKRNPLIIITSESINLWGYDTNNSFESSIKLYDFKDYQPSSLTPCEMAIWDCLLDVFEEVKG